MITYKKACLGALASAAMLLCAAQAQAQSFAFDQKFDLGGFDGNVFGTFTVNDVNAPIGIFDQSEMTFNTLRYIGIAPVLGFVDLTFAGASITSNITTNWFPLDRTLGDAFNGFFLDGASAGTQMTWVAGPGNFFDYGNTPGLNTGGDLQNSTFRFGQITLYDSLGSPFASAQSDEYVTTAIPEPSTYLMMLGGVAALALKVRRRAA